MSEISMYEAQKKKMEGLCEEHDLTYRFQKDTYWAEEYAPRRGTRLCIMGQRSGAG